jgi:hypothetical protein
MSYPKEISINSNSINRYKNNKRNSVNNINRGLKRLRSYIVDNKLHLFRARSTGFNTIDKRGGVSFYGTSIYDVKSYNTSLSKKKFYEMVLTSESNLNDIIVDLSIPRNSRIVVDYYNSNVDTDENKAENINLLETLFFGKELDANGKLPDNTIVARNSDDLDDDLEMVKILKKIFPGKIGSFTSGSRGLKHNEVIIWDSSINKRIAKHKSFTTNSKKNRSPKSSNGPGSRLSFGSPTSPNGNRSQYKTKLSFGSPTSPNSNRSQFKTKLSFGDPKSPNKKKREIGKKSKRSNNNINSETKTKFKKLGIKFIKHSNL